MSGELGWYRELVIQFSDGKWEIEGRDPRGKTINMDVDAMTGAVMKVDRY